LALIGAFLTRGAEALSLEQVMMGKVFTDNVTKQYVFKGNALMEFILDQRKFRGASQAEIQERLKRMGGIAKRKYLNDKNPGCRVWTLPIAALEGTVDNLDGISPIAYMETEEKNEAPDNGKPSEF
jgi:hypothetical protein